MLTRRIAAFSNDSVIYAHARLPLVHLELILYVLSAIYVARWLVVIRLRKTVHLVRRRHLETRELAARLHEGAAQPLLRRVALRSLVHAFPLHVQVRCVHRVTLHVRAQVVHLIVIGRPIHQVIVDKICVAARHRILIQRPLLVVYFGALMHDRVRNSDRVSLSIWLLILFADCSLILLLWCATRST